MSNSGKFALIGKIAGLGLIGSALVSKAAASVIAPLFGAQQAEQSTVWSNLRSEFETPSVDAPLDEKLVEHVLNAAPGPEFESAIRDSYAMAQDAHVGTLDKLWIKTLIQNSGSYAIAEYLSIRSTIADASTVGRTEYMDSWIWRTTVPIDTGGS